MFIIFLFKKMKKVGQGGGGYSPHRPPPLVSAPVCYSLFCYSFKCADGFTF